MISDRGEQTTYSLNITHPTATDSGPYQSDPSASNPQHVNVLVINTSVVINIQALLKIFLQEDQMMQFSFSGTPEKLFLTFFGVAILHSTLDMQVEREAKCVKLL